MKSKKYSAFDIAQWFINRAKLDADLTCDETNLISQLKLQKLLYYAQACSLALNNERLFDDSILAWKLGPVVEKVYQKYKPCGRRPIEYFEPVAFDEETEVLLEFIYSKFAIYQASHLVNLTHNDDCFNNTLQSHEINIADIKSDFEKKWLKDVDIETKKEQYLNTAETAYLNSFDKLSEYLKNENANATDEVVDLDWTKLNDTK